MSEITSPPWPQTPISECCDILDSQRVPISETERAKRKGTVPYYGANGLQGWIDRPLFNDDLVLIAEDGGNFDDFATRPIAYAISGPSWVNNHAHVLRAREGMLHAWLLFNLAHRDIRNFVQGGTRAKLNQAQLRLIRVSKPPLVEQTRIAEILDTLDEAIREAEAVIAKLRQVKAGLLHDLLTRGLDENGQLRDPLHHPDQFQNSTLGLIPKAWSVTTLRDVTNRITDGAHTTVKTVEASNDTVPFLFVSCVRDGRVLWDQAGAISRSTFQDISRGREPSAGMVLFTVVGSYGHAASVQDDSPFSFQRHIACLYPQKDKLDSRFLVHWMNSPGFKVFGDNVALGNAQKTITLGALNLLPCLLPSFPEQQEIMRKITPVDARIDAEQKNLAKLQILKRGLSHDLLTGQKRVKV